MSTAGCFAAEMVKKPCLRVLCQDVTGIRRPEAGIHPVHQPVIKDVRLIERRHAEKVRAAVRGNVRKGNRLAARDAVYFTAPAKTCHAVSRILSPKSFMIEMRHDVVADRIPLPAQMNIRARAIHRRLEPLRRSKDPFIVPVSFQ